jgi:uncharacterized repeat protein (TIGR03803 family)
LVLGEDESLYGTTSAYDGTVFKVNKDGSSHTTPKVFTNADGDGSGPQARLLKGRDGLLYGTTVGGGETGHGTVFALCPDARSKIIAVNRDSSGVVSLKAWSAAGIVIRLQSATNIAAGTWTGVATITASVIGALNFADLATDRPRVLIVSSHHELVHFAPH